MFVFKKKACNETLSYDCPHFLNEKFEERSVRDFGQGFSEVFVNLYIFSPTFVEFSVQNV